MADEPLKTELNNQGDYVSGDIGADGKDVVVGKNIDTRRKQQENQSRSESRQTQRGGNLRAGDTYVNEGNRDSSQWVTGQILDHGQQIRELIYRLDNIPIEFQEFKARVKKLEDTEIVVRPSEVVIRPLGPVEPSETVTLSARTIAKILIASLIIFPAIIVALIYFR